MPRLPATAVSWWKSGRIDALRPRPARPLRGAGGRPPGTPMSVWDKLRAGLGRTRQRFEQQVGTLLGRRSVDPETRDRLEEALLAADVGPATTDRLIERAEALLAGEPELDLRGALERTAAAMLEKAPVRFAPDGRRPWVALLVGVNGVGKTTLAGKLAARFARDGRRTLLV